MDSSLIGKLLIFIGMMIAIIGGLFLVFSHLGIFLGKLPGDIKIEGEKTLFSFPIVTSLIISAFLTIVLNLIFWLFRK